MWEGIARAGVVAAVLTTAASAGVVFPGPQWEFRTPQDSGLGANLLQQFGDTVGGRGCVVRYGYMVHTWGSQIQRSDISSAAKPIYTHFLFKAVEDGAIPSLDDLVVDFEPGTSGR